MTLVLAAALVAPATSVPALDFKRDENVGGLHLKIPIDYVAGGHDDAEFLLAMHWPSLLPAAADGAPPLGRDILFIDGDEDQLALALPARFETMRRYVGAAPQAAGERFGLQVFPRDAVLSQGHYDPHLELLVHAESGEIRSVVTCDIEGAAIGPVCHDELVFHRAHITLSFAKALLEDWQAMEIRSQQLLMSFSASDSR
ncbi:MAG TPA: hypothetical protein VLA85_16780 [Verrucomicrobiae bacterium]|jgi:hypothetical protein|nr:hypothetical protein [Verrucomicrobiae bacterium]